MSCLKRLKLLKMSFSEIPPNMINIKKVANDIYSDGKYDAMLDSVKKALNSENPSLEAIEKLVIEDSYYVKEYKDLNRWGELTSVHIKELEIKPSDSKEAKKLKEKINKEIDYLILGEEYEIPSKKTIYITWTGFIALPTIYVIDNVVRMFTTLYITHENHIYFSFLIVLILSVWGYLMVSRNHKRQHTRYIKTQKKMRELVKTGLEKNYFSFDEVYKD
ncbi:hypothetical protein GSY74_09115 [Sulfurovum sp. bin170]|uniref:hypothetical protein n=1 Tax=Sulfurovum sp. bin170 TaxID=2695268 RepID=UPI0013DF10D8|nr:hypothetical protein [Sulfurovum sp. bin170]NEW61440.1 hypothetical protein [Sulfurovum sp. bin170]